MESTANYFEHSGIKIDLTKVASHFYCSTGGVCGEVCINMIGVGFGKVTLPPATGRLFLDAMEAYRESLKTKYQFKDGWYICDLDLGTGRIERVLRYSKNDAAYDAEGQMQMKHLALYKSARLVDKQPACPDSLRD